MGGDGRVRGGPVGVAVEVGVGVCVDGQVVQADIERRSPIAIALAVVCGRVPGHAWTGGTRCERRRVVIVVGRRVAVFACALEMREGLHGSFLFFVFAVVFGLCDNRWSWILVDEGLHSVQYVHISSRLGTIDCTEHVFPARPSTSINLLYNIYCTLSLETIKSATAHIGRLEILSKKTLNLPYL